MRKLIATTMVSLDGVMQAPGGPEEDPTGGGHLIQTLQVAGLINEFNVWTFPVVLGRGKRLFEAGAKPGALRLVASQTSTTGVVMSTYVAAGDVPHGSFVQDEPSAKEVQRRAKLARGGVTWPQGRRSLGVIPASEIEPAGKESERPKANRQLSWTTIGA